MDDYTAVALAEGFETTDDPERIREAWQHLHTTGLGYCLQGWFGRVIAQLLDSGEIDK